MIVYHSGFFASLKVMDNVTVADHQFQERILIGVSRTFAITIPQLPAPLREQVGTAYLLCRIVDTIEDDAALTVEQKRYFCEQFTVVVNDEGEASVFSQALSHSLSDQTLSAERELVREMPRVIRLLRSYSCKQQTIIRNAVAVMTRGMPLYGRITTTLGLPTMHDLDKYCYYVAGVVGEMLTELFCGYSPDIAVQQTKLRWLAVSFGQALQMTNILKDIWDDYARGVCWLPQQIFKPLGIDLANLKVEYQSEYFALGMQQLVAIALAHCRNALAFVQAIPAHEAGIRRFCLRALMMAVLTLRKIYQNPNYSNKRQVTISRRAVQWTLLATDLFSRSNRWLGIGMRLLTRNLPIVPLAAEWEPSQLSEYPYAVE